MLLEDLARALAVIAAAREPNDVIDALLRATRAPLHFGRAVYFELRGDLLIAQSTLGTFSPQPTSLPAGLWDVAGRRRGAETIVTGKSPEVQAPFSDARDEWIIAPLVYARQIDGFLYADGFKASAGENYLERLKVLVAVAAAALRGSFLYRRLSELALRDPLTGLLNRRSIEERLRDEIEAARRSCSECVLTILDVDDFKRINDVDGHAGGDAVLALVATTLSRVSREGDLVGRLGGDEFLILFRRTVWSESRFLVRRLSRELQRSGLRCSLGAAIFPRDASDAEGLLRAADRALYAVKAGGKNGFAFI